jgi:hypothetical protein
VWRAVAVPSHAVDFFARLGTRATSCIAASYITNQVAAISYAVESVATGSERRRVEDRCSRWSLSRL